MSMSRGKRIFRSIAKRLSGVVLCKNVLVVRPTEHLVRGFLIETTSERDRVYLWRVVTLLHRPIRTVILSYSERISGSQSEIYLNRDDYEKSADDILAIIAGPHIEYLQKIRRPQDFLRHTSWIVDGSPPLYRLDHALTHCLIGNMRVATDMFRAIDREVDQWDAARQEYIQPLVKQLMRQIDEDPAGLTALLNKWENENVERHGLQPSRAPTDRLRLVVS
jgi:hypothetical protein